MNRRNGAEWMEQCLAGRTTVLDDSCEIARLPEHLQIHALLLNQRSNGFFCLLLPREHVLGRTEGIVPDGYNSATLME